MLIEIDKTDYEFITKILLRAEAHWEIDMTDAERTQSYRDRCRENAKMARQSLEMLYGSTRKKKEDAQ